MTTVSWSEAQAALDVAIPGWRDQPEEVRRGLTARAAIALLGWRDAFRKGTE